MKLEEIYEEIAKDFPINKNDLGGETIRTTNLFMKYVKLYEDEKLVLKKINLDKRALYSKKLAYYSGDGTPEEYAEKPFNLRLATQAARDKYVEMDPEMLKFEERVIISEIKIDLLSECLWEIKRRGAAIKTAVDWERFRNGG